MTGYTVIEHAPPPTPPRDKTCWVPPPPPRHTNPGARTRFQEIRANRDGKISAAELGTIMSSLHNTTDEELQKMMKEIDSDVDGFIDLG
ncbi:hypothetical protein Dsin_031746 [Dipteronia sinensis]|uniref:EF-hand domain-containing protein n=1 Tax=Dipteronia sinensis TaxID=43782 RepID=A0AAE0DTN4_9ROSI|nr:hypothetical protein Dsin_031746 [Dipteronia sinensis]